MKYPPVGKGIYSGLKLTPQGAQAIAKRIASSK